MTQDEYYDLVDGDELPKGHSYLFQEDPDDEYNRYCECGKWIEPGTYDHWEHLAASGC